MQATAQQCNPQRPFAIQPMPFGRVEAEALSSVITTRLSGESITDYLRRKQAVSESLLRAAQAPHSHLAQHLRGPELNGTPAERALLLRVAACKSLALLEG